VLLLLSEVNETLKSFGKRYEPVDSSFHVNRVQSLEELSELEETLRDDEKRSAMVSFAERR